MQKKHMNWRHVSSMDHSGVFVWDIVEADGDNNPYKSSFVECRDGSYIYILCYHFWTMERAEGFMSDEQFDDLFTVVNV